MDSMSDKSKLTIPNVLVLTYYIALAITSFYGVWVCGTRDEYDVMLVKKLNCTCFSEVDYQCSKESARKGLSINHVKCDIIKGEQTQYKLCDCGSRVKSKCFSPQCYVIENLVAVPEYCKNEVCNALDGLENWLSAASLGALVGCIGAILMLLLMFKAPKTTRQDMSISTFYLVHLGALVPPAMIVFSMMTTNVLSYYANVGLNTWAWIMVIVFGVPLCIGWICSCHVTFSKAYKYRKAQNTNIVEL